MHGRPQIEARRTRTGVIGKRQAFAMGKAADRNFDRIHSAALGAAASDCDEPVHEPFRHFFLAELGPALHALVRDDMHPVPFASHDS